MGERKSRSDALVFFGAAGDLAFKKIYPALHALARRGKLDFPVVGVARAGWPREQLIDRAKSARWMKHAALIDGELHRAFARREYRGNHANHGRL